MGDTASGTQGPGPADAPLVGYYQDKVAPHLSERLALIEDAVLRGGRSLVDVGSNLGDVTAHFARRGMFALGVEIDPGAVAEARRRHADVERCAFAQMALTPETVDSLPATDVVLLLSVHHNWVAAHGLAGADDMLASLLARTRVLVLEGPSRRRRYGKEWQPGFVDNDEDSVVGWYRAYLGEQARAAGARLDLLGSAPCLGEREPRRWIWAFTREVAP